MTVNHIGTLLRSVFGTNYRPGSALASTGDNGIVHLWRESIDGSYIEFAETEPA